MKEPPEDWEEIRWRGNRKRVLVGEAWTSILLGIPIYASVVGFVIGDAPLAWGMQALTLALALLIIWRVAPVRYAQNGNRLAAGAGNAKRNLSARRLARGLLNRGETFAHDNPLLLRSCRKRDRL